MASSNVDTIISLSVKGKELYNKCHFERSLQKWRAARAAAEALGAEDCVILAAAMTKTARVSALAELARGMMPGVRVRLTEAFILEVFAQYAASAAILRRRRDAGTLLEGKCRPDEVRWKLGYIQGLASVPETEIWTYKHMASLVGYDTFLELAYTCIELACSVLSIDRVFQPGGEAERTWFSFTCNLCDEAVALMMLPRSQSFHRSSAESDVLVGLQQLKEALSAGAQDKRWRVRVAVALARLHQSGVIEERCLGDAETISSVADADETFTRGAQERMDAVASGQLRSCALTTCGAREGHPSHFSKCGACKTVSYCCREHQLQDWPAHKAACKAARKAAAAKDAA